MAIPLNDSIMTNSSRPIPAATAPLEEPHLRFISLDEEGYFALDGLRVSDIETGADWLSRMRIDAGGAAYFRDEQNELGENITVIVEAFDQPLVAHDLNPETWEVNLPYGVVKRIVQSDLRVDEWDRFHFRTTEGIPGVLSRSAQSRFFEAIDNYDDDSVTVNGERILVAPLYEETPDARHPAWWDSLYHSQSNRWDLGQEHPLMDELIPPLKISRSRILILGCGQGHDAHWWARRGHIVTAVDFSEVAIQNARARYGESSNLRWLSFDALNAPSNMTSSFDLIFEHTLYCAIPPAQRKALAKTWWRLLSPRGRVLGFVPTMDKHLGPPYGGTEWEFRKHIFESERKTKALFRPLIWKRLRKGPARRRGKELFFVVERVESFE
jgi:SAM-dependent methyltransferase